MFVYRHKSRFTDHFTSIIPQLVIADLSLVAGIVHEPRILISSIPITHFDLQQYRETQEHIGHKSPLNRLPRS